MNPVPKCEWCQEPLLPTETQDQGMHIECIARAVLGSVGHQQRLCSCYGGTEDDPPGMTLREAAKAAYIMGRYAHDAISRAQRN